MLVPVSFALFFVAAHPVTLSPRRVKYSNILRRIFVELGRAAIAAELHESVAHNALHRVAYGAELALGANNASRKRVRGAGGGERDSD